ncbi:EAL domain-containing protein [Sphingomonas oligophenolica]|uniref:EAL domain-containing protein n=1 Tax=Sphingomonas oligophenolica TaxID=301154 RepID=A0ABU9Y0I9_9SPHN
MLRLQNIILEMVAKGEGLKRTTDRLCVEVERMVPDIICSVLTVDHAGLLHPLSGPSLPESYSAALDGLAIGPNTGSCGTAAYLQAPVSVTDIEHDPLWANYKQLALPLGFKACWSSPICGSQGRVLGTFAFYYRRHRGPSEIEEKIVGTCLHLCAIALERHERVLERDRLANVDGLTGLSNRACFSAALGALTCAEPGAWALLVADLDNLKMVNDTFGHHAGDILLEEVASRIAAACEPDKAYRLGGDEFAVIVQAPEALRDLDAAAARILERLIEPVQCDGHLVHPQATIGGAILSHADHGADSVRQNADFALYHAKETGRGGFVRYWPGIGTAITHRLSAIRDVGIALRESRLDAYYQPVVRLDTREIIGLEALCRLTTESGEIVSAAEFSDATSDMLVASGMTELMLSRVASDIRAWLDMGIPIQHVSINLSAADFQRGGLDAQLIRAFQRENVSLEHLIVEITEDVYLGRGALVATREIKAIRRKGLRVALDDFGTGFASLTHLLTVPADVIKIDKSFIGRLTPEDASSAIVEGLFLIARKLGIHVIAEGIETESQLSQLRDFGCLFGQGYLFSRPVDRHATTDLLLRLAQKPAKSIAPPGAGPRILAVKGSYPQREFPWAAAAR